MSAYDSTHTGAQIDNIVDNGLLRSEAISLYLSKTDAASTYLTQTNAASTYQPILSNSDSIVLGGLTVRPTSGEAIITAADGTHYSDNTFAVQLDLNPTNGNHGIWSSGYMSNNAFTSNGVWMIYRDSTGKIIIPNDLNVQGAVIQSTKIYTRVYYAGSGDTQFTSWIPFNTTVENVGGGSWSNGYYSVPSAGYYFCTFSCYSNQPTEGRPAVARLNSSNTIQLQEMVNGNQSTSVTAIFHCNAGDKLVAGAYSSSFPIRFYAANGHNAFTIMRIY